MNGTEQNEKRKQTEIIDKSQGIGGAGVGGIHRRATGADAAWAAHPGPDHRPRPPATTGFPAWSCGRGLHKGRGSLARLWSPAGSRKLMVLDGAKKRPALEPDAEISPAVERLRHGRVRRASWTSPAPSMTRASPTPPVGSGPRTAFTSSSRTRRTPEH